LRFGMHLSFSQGPARAKSIGAKVLQVFCGNPRGWQKTPLDPEFVARFKADVAANGISPVVVHATYLINLAARDENFYKLSASSFVTEIERAAQIGAQFYVVHIGNHMGAGPEEGRRRVAACMKLAVKQVPNGPDILAENTAGGGTTLGTTFEEIKLLMDECCTDRLGLCLDTCHALSAGYDIRTPKGVSEMLDCIDRTIGLKRLRCLHLNDSKGELGSHLDRHEHIGAGAIGAAGFKALFADKRLWHLPAVLETPREHPQDELRDLWTAIEYAIDAGAVKRSDVGERPEESDATAADKSTLRIKAPAPKPKLPKPAAAAKPENATAKKSIVPKIKTKSASAKTRSKK
jgi:deoxyribonuclease IV